MDEEPPRKNTISLILLFFAFALGFGSVLAFVYFRAPKPVITTPEPVASDPQAIQTPIVLVPPARALSGTLTVLKGHTEMFTRTGDAFAEASTGAQVLLGESVHTKEGASAKIVIDNFLTATMEENAEVVFASFFADNMVLQQKTGRVTYELTGDAKPVAIRALHALASIRSGEVIINIIDADVSVTVKTGSVKLALVDNDNETHVWELTEGQRANIDDEARDVRILKAR